MLVVGLVAIGSTAGAQDTTRVKSAVKAASVAKDPFAGDTWHAVTPSWPGTIKFDGAKKSVVLEPLAGPVIEATYSFQVKETKGGEVAGSLKMISAAGEASDSQFVIKDKRLTLQFAGGVQEHYQRLTAKEAEAEKERLRQVFEKLKAKKNAVLPR